MLSASAPITVLNAAELEALGDLKLYRIPEPVTLAARSQKQVAFLTRQHVRIRFAWRQSLSLADVNRERHPARYLLTRNRESEGLGEPLPAGGFALFGQGADRTMLLGQGALGDRAVGEDVEVWLGESPGVTTSLRVLSRTRRVARLALIVSNDQPQPLTFEGDLTFGAMRANARLGRRNGRPLWSVDVPANGRSVLCFSIRTGPAETLPAPRADEDVVCPAG
jgi:hypothetical protein